jgi:hypothetical protein
MAVRALKIAKLVRDPSIQPRTDLDKESIQQYADAMEAGAVFPPIAVFKIDKKFIVVAGWHRIAAAELRGLAEIRAEIIEDKTLRDAKLFAIGDNSKHGVRLSNADKRRAVESLLQDDEWASKSNREIAAYCGVSHEHVRRIKEERERPDDTAPEEAEPKPATESTGETGESGDSWGDEETKPEGESKPTTIEEPMRDKVGNFVPPALIPAFTEGSDFFKAAIHNLTATRDSLAEAAKVGQFGKFLREQDVTIPINNVIESLKFARPHAVCPECEGRGCDPCRQQGWMPKALYDAAVESEPVPTE